MNLQGKIIHLVPMSMEFVTETYRSWLSDCDVTKYLCSLNVTLEELKDYVSQRINKVEICFWAILDNGTNAHIGNVKLEPIVRHELRATFGILIGNKDFWGRGIATEVTELVVDFAFNHLKLKSLDLGVERANVAAIRAYKKVGFHIEELEGHQKATPTSVFMIKRSLS